MQYAAQKSMLYTHIRNEHQTLNGKILGVTFTMYLIDEREFNEIV